ncbi:MAG: hypothetical protein KAS32_25190 [Candidatus Peribacteraceae bacterium]|nr:hypothetical protein [Candidatus Peribacteraceae bacterium]
MSSGYSTPSNLPAVTGLTVQAAQINDLEGAVSGAFANVDSDISDATIGVVANAGYAQEWAVKATAVSVAAGGDGSTTFSSKYNAELAAADKVLTNADVVSTNADVVSTNADVVTTGNNVTAAQLAETNAETAQAAAEATLPTFSASEQGAIGVQNATDDGWETLSSQGTAKYPLVSAGLDANPVFEPLEATGVKAGEGILNSERIAGSTIQVVNVQDGAVATGTTVLPIDNTIPQNTEGDEYMTLAVTPTSATNKLKIEIACFISNSQAAAARLGAALFQDSTANALAAGIGSRDGSAGAWAPVHFTHYMTAGTTNEITFKVRAGNSASGTTTFNGQTGSRVFGGVMASSMTITEIQV